MRELRTWLRSAYQDVSTVNIEEDKVQQICSLLYYSNNNKIDVVFDDVAL
jgi:hypothetical protein